MARVLGCRALDEEPVVESWSRMEVVKVSECKALVEELSDELGSNGRVFWRQHSK